MRRLHSDAPHDRGAGLPELIVSMALFTVLAGALGAAFLGSMDSVRTASTKNVTTADARIAMEVLSRTLRVAVRPQGEASAVVEARPDRLVIFASLDRSATQSITRPTQVTYSHDSVTGCLNETQVVAQSNTGSNAGAVPLLWPGAGTTRCLIRTTVPPAFDYYDVATVASAAGTPVSPLTLPPTGLASAARERVVSVQATVTVTDPRARDVPGVTARDRVTLANVLSDRSATGGV